MGKILLAEDEAIVRLALTDVLARAGHEVIQAADGADALARLPCDVGVIITDMMMPRMTGADWVVAARGRPGMGGVPVIFMSALPLPPMAAPLATAFLAKPFTADRLLAAVECSLADRARE